MTAYFEPDFRNRRRQQSCRLDACRRASKQARQRRWVSKPENESYFRGPEHVERVREWRAQHPGYWRRCRRTVPLQDALEVQVPEKTSPLQDALNHQPIVLIGLIAQITGTTLQDDIAYTTSHLLRLGRDILSAREVNNDGTKGAYPPRTGTVHSEAV